MATAKLVDGVAMVGFVNGVAVDSEGRAIKGGPKPTPDTDPSEQPSGANALTSEERMGLAIANALQGKPPTSASAPKGKAKKASSDEKQDGDRVERPEMPGLPAIGELGDHLAGLKSAEEVEALQKGDERKGAQRFYKARLAELKSE